MKSETIDAWSRIVENPTPPYRDYFARERAFLLSHLPEDAIFLDVGCGTGRTIRSIASSVRQAVGIDNDPVAVMAARKNLENLANASVSMRDGEYTRFGDGAFNATFTGLTFVNLGASRMRVLAEMARVLQRKGVLALSAYHEDALPHRREVYDAYTPGYEILDEPNGTVLLENGTLSEQFRLEQIEEMLAETRLRITEVDRGALAYLVACEKY